MKKPYLSLIALFAMLQFSYAQNTNPWPSTGSVGIGTTSPAAPLHVVDAGTSGVTTLKLNNRFTFSGDGVMKWGPSANYGLLSWDTDKAFVGGQTGASLLLLADNSEKVRIATNGNVGISTTAPVDKLDVNGHISLSGGSREIHFRDAGNTLRHSVWITPTNVLGMGPGSESNSMFVNTAGNVSIGTLSVPSGYKFAVNGAAIATSMKVQMKANWPDFVFLKNYKLPALAEVKTYIDKNQHLPDMPSADEVHKHGLDLGEMNRLLLKKLEELTLYLIEKDQQLIKQQLKTEQQERRLAEIESALTKLKVSN